jgi:hypothetical protein
MHDTYKVVRKAINIAVTTSTVLWSVGAASFAPLAAHAATPGQLIKMSGNSSVYYLHTDMKRYVWPNEATYKSWYPDFSGVVTVSQSELQSYTIGSTLTMRAGTYLGKVTTDPKVYAIQPGGVFRWVQTESIAKTLYGDNWASKVVDIPDVFFSNYSVGTPISTNAYPTGSLVKSSTSSDIWYVDGSSKRKITSAGLTANKFNTAYVVTGQDLVLNALTVGMEITGAESALWSVVAGASTNPTGTGLTVALASDTPASGILPTGSALNPVLKLNLTASNDGAVNVTALKIRRMGFSLDSDVAGIGVYDSAGARHGNVVTLSENIATVTFTNDPIVVAAGQTTSVWVKVNVNVSGSTSGTMQFSVENASAVVTSATVNGSFPVSGNAFSLTNGANSLGALDVDAVTISATTTTVDIGTMDQAIGKFKLTETSSREDVKITRIRFFNNGNTTDGDLSNIELVEVNSGAVLATVAATTNRYATFTLNYTLAKGTNRHLQIRADVVNGSTRTAQFVVQNDYDIDVMGVSTGAFILPVHAAGVDTVAGFPVGEESTTYNAISINAGSLTAAKDSSSRSGDVGQGEGQAKLAAFKLEAIGEDIELQKIQVDLSGQTSDDGDLSGTLSVKANDVTIYSVAANNDDLWDASPAQTTLSSYYTIKGGTSVILTVVGDIHSSNAVTGETFKASIDEIYYKKVSSNNFATMSTAISGNTLTVTTASLSVSKNTAFANQTQVAGASGLKIGSYTLQAGTAEGVNVTSAQITLSAVTGITNLKLRNGSTQIGSTIGSPVAGANTFSFSLPIPVSGTATIDVYADTSTTAVSVTTSIAASGIGASGATSGTTLATIPAATVTGQTITISGGGTLAVTADAATPNQAILHANETGVSLLTLRLSATGEAVNVGKIVVESANGSSNYQNLKLMNGATQVGQTASLVDGKATFAGLSVVSPKDGSVTLVLKADTTDTGTMRSADYTAFSVSDIEATGAASGSQIYPATLSTTFSAAAVDETESVTVASTIGFNTGDAILVHNTTSGVEYGVVLSVTSSTVMVIAVETDMASVAGIITKLPSVVTVAPTTGTLDQDGTVAASVIPSTKGFAVGDIVIAHNVTDGAELGVVISIDSTTAMKIGLNTDFTAAVTRVTKLSSGATTAASAGTLLAAGTAAGTVTSTAGFAVGDAVVAYNTTDGAQFGIVVSIDSSTAMKVATEADMTAAVSRITKLATFETTAASAGTPIVGGAAVTVTSSAGFAANDPVIAFNATDGVELGIATAVGSSTAVTVAPRTNMTAAASRVSRLWGLTASSSSFIIHDVEPIIALNASSPSGASSGATNQSVAKINITAGGYRDLTIKAITITRGGNIGANVATSATPKIYINGDLKGTGATWSGTTAGSTSVVTLTSPYTISAGEVATLDIQVDTSSAVATNTFQVYLDGVAGTFGNLSWYYDVSASSPGFTTAPTNASPATVSDNYPTYGNTLTY